MQPYQIQVIIPVYNGQLTLGRCLDSLVSQTYLQWQALIVDDGSTDDSFHIMKEYAARDGRFVCLRAEKNGGPTRARNLALEKADAPYIAFLDADDTWEPDMLEVLYRAAVNRNADVVQCQFLYELPGGERLYPKGAFSQDVFLEGKELRAVYLRMLTGINMNHVCMKLIRRSCLEGVRFRTELKTAEDLDFCVRLFQNVRSYYFTTNRLYHYFRCTGSLTGGGLSLFQRFDANREVSRTIAAALPRWGMNGPGYRVLAWGRPYLVACSKALRILREKWRESRNKRRCSSESK